MTTPSDIIKIACDNRIALMNTCMPAQIVSFDYATNKANVQPCLNKRLTDNTVIPVPIINNVPVCFPQNSTFSMTFPVKEGDYCLLVFAQRSLDLWKTDGGVVTPDDFRKYDLSDAVALLGVQPFNVPSQAANNDDFLLKFAGSEIKIRANGEIDIKTASRIALGTPSVELIDQIVQLLNSLITNLASGPGPYPGVVTDATTIRLALNSIKGTIT